MKRIIRVVLLVFACLTGSYADISVSGFIVDIADRPVSGATIRLAGSGQETVSAGDGTFSLSGASAVIDAMRYKTPRAVNFAGDRISMNLPAGAAGEVIVYNSLGRAVLAKKFRSSGTVMIPLAVRSGGRLSDGSYVCMLRAGNARLQNRAISINGAFRWQHPVMRAGVHFDRALAKSLTILDSAIVTKNGYNQSVALLTETNVSGLVIRLYPEDMAALQKVTVRESTWTTNITITPKPGPLNSHDGIWASEGYGWEPVRIEQNGSKIKLLGTISKEVAALVVENGLIRVVVSPLLGMRVVQATDLTLNKSMFYVADPIQGYRIWDVGGVEGSWPFFEHGLHIMADESGTGFQSAGYRIVHDADGSVIVAMNMHFEAFQDSADGALQGRYSDRPMSTMLRVSPGSSQFWVTHRVENPNPTPRSNRVWNDALFEKGSPDAQIVIPARWAVFHYAKEVYDLNEYYGKTQEQWYSESGYRNRSMFAVYGNYPFVGVYYPTQRVNRVRIHDPEKAPGIKCYIQESLDFIEFWGSTVALFEDPGTFVGPYEPTGFTNSYYMTGDIGPLSYANEHLALGVDTTARTFKLTAPAAYEVIVRDFSGAELAAGRIGPALPPLAGSCPDNEIMVLSAGGTELMRESFPLVYPDNLDERYDSLLWASARSTMNPPGRLPANFEGCGNALDDCREFNYELEGLQNNTLGVRDYHGIKAAANATGADDPAYLLSLARVCYRYGCFDRTVELCDMITANQHAEYIAYLKGLIALEQGQEPDFSAAGNLADYHRGLLAIQAGDTAEAISRIAHYVQNFPQSFRPAVCLAWLKGDLGAARSLEKLNPASVELTWALSELGDAAASQDLATLLAGNAGAAEALDRFKLEVQQGLWAPTPRWQAFPEHGCVQLSLLKP